MMKKRKKKDGENEDTIVVNRQAEVESGGKAATFEIEDMNKNAS